MILKRSILAVFFINTLFSTLHGFSQEVLLNSPYSTMIGHYTNLKNKPQNINLASLALFQGDLGQEELEKKALKLFRIYLGRGMWIAGEDIPKDPNYFDSSAKKNEFHPFSQEPDIYLVKYGDQWLYSRFTVERIDQLYKDTYPLGEDQLLNLIPKEAQTKFLGIEIWKYGAFLVLILLAYLVYKLFILFLKNGIVRALKKVPFISRASPLILRIARPLSFLIVIGFFRVLIPILQLPIDLNYILTLLMKAAGPLILTIVAYRVVDLASGYFLDLSKKTEGTLDDQLVPLLGKLVKSIAIILGSVFVLVALEINVLPLLTGLSIGGLAFALAAQDTLKNFFGSIMIFLDKPFQIGHWIVAGEIDGTVEEVGFRSTRIRTFKNSVTYVPNGKIADTIVENYGLRAYRRMNIKISIKYDTPPRLIELFVDGLKRITMDHPKTWKERKEIHFNGMADSSLSIMFYIFFEVPSWSEELEARHDILLQILKLAEALGVKFAFPTQTLHMENFPGKESLSPGYSSDSKIMEQKFNSFFNSNDQ